MRMTYVSLFTVMSLAFGSVHADETPASTEVEMTQPVETNAPNTTDTSPTPSTEVETKNTEEKPGVAAVESIDTAKKTRWQSIALAVAVVTVAVVSIILVSNSHSGS